MASRLGAMDAQRYDLSKRRSLRALSIMTRATSGHIDSSEALLYTGPWMDQTPLTPNNTPISTTFSLESSAISTNVESSPFNTPLSNVSVASITLEDGTSTQTCGTDCDLEDGPSALCTIIRPMARPSLLGLFSRFSSPTTRSNSSVIFNMLNRLRVAKPFEDDVDYLQTQRSKVLAGKADIRVLITQHEEVHVEELWREAIQDILYAKHTVATIGSSVGTT